MASFLSTAASFLGRTSLSANYTIDASAAPVYCGNWKIQRAVRNSGSGGVGPSNGAGASASSSSSSSSPAADLGAGKGVVSVWEAKLDARGSARQLVVDMLKKEAASLTRLRHPCILSVVEPVEETRNTLVFATEPVVASLQQAVIASESAGRASAEVALDEVEIQKGLLQVARGLEFLHSAGMVHGNLDGHSVCINAKGDWKLCGFGFLTPLRQPDGAPTPYTHPDYDPSLPPSLSVNFDYLAPEYALDEKREPANDMYSLGCIVYAVHSRGDPPFRNRNSLANLRANADRLSTVHGSAEWKRLGRDVVELLTSLLTRFPGGRLTAQSFQHAGYFNNILVSTLKFLERESFSGRTKEERVQFLKGLRGVLPQFSDRLLRRKVLPALLELMSDRSLLPFILPNVFHIANTLSSIEFTSSVLPRLQPLFSVQDPPQNQLMLLDQIDLFVSKTSPAVFREGVTPLLYSALEAEQAVVQERALQQVPRLCEVLEYSHVKEVLFPRIAALFSKTKILSVKVNTLISFHHMIPILDKYTLTEKLVPLLARIKTREPSVMVATLAVHEALATKVDRETLAIHIIPQLWAMSMGPLLNADQFDKFMRATRDMGERVAREHAAHLREVRRMQEHTDEYRGGGGGGGEASDQRRAGGRAGGGAGGEVDFATLVGSGRDTGAGTVPRDAALSSQNTGSGANGSGSGTGSGNGLAGFDPFAFDDIATAVPPARTVTPLGPSATPGVLTPVHTGGGGVGGGAGGGIGGGSTSYRPALASANANPTRSYSSSSLSAVAGSASGSGSGSGSGFAKPPLPASRPSFGTGAGAGAVGAARSAAASPAPGPAPPPGWGTTLVPSSSSSLKSMGSPSGSGSGGGGAGGGGGPNYNISLPPASGFGATSDPGTGAMTMAGGLPPLVPQTSSLGSLSGAGTGAGMGAGMGSGMGVMAPQGTGTGGSGSGILQPLKPQSSAKSSMAGAAGKGKSEWGEFDPFA